MPPKPSGLPVIALLLACSTEPAWVVQRGSIVPGATGMEGTQTWEFYTTAWSPDAGDQEPLCARTQSVVGTLTTTPACPDCRAAYDLTLTELDADCADDLVRDPSFSGPALYAIGEVSDEIAPTEPVKASGGRWDSAMGSWSTSGMPTPKRSTLAKCHRLGWRPALRSRSRQQSRGSCRSLRGG